MLVLFASFAFNGSLAYVAKCTISSIINKQDDKSKQKLFSSWRNLESTIWFAHESAISDAGRETKDEHPRLSDDEVQAVESRIAEIKSVDDYDEDEALLLELRILRANIRAHQQLQNLEQESQDRANTGDAEAALQTAGSINDKRAAIRCSVHLWALTVLLQALTQRVAEFGSTLEQDAYALTLLSLRDGACEVAEWLGLHNSRQLAGDDWCKEDFDKSIAQNLLQHRVLEQVGVRNLLHLARQGISTMLSKVNETGSACVTPPDTHSNVLLDTLFKATSKLSCV